MPLRTPRRRSVRRNRRRPRRSEKHCCRSSRLGPAPGRGTGPVTPSVVRSVPPTTYGTSAGRTRDIGVRFSGGARLRGHRRSRDAGTRRRRGAGADRAGADAAGVRPTELHDPLPLTATARCHSGSATPVHGRSAAATVAGGGDAVTPRSSRWPRRAAPATQGGGAAGRAMHQDHAGRLPDTECHREPQRHLGESAGTSRETAQDIPADLAISCSRWWNRSPRRRSSCRPGASSCRRSCTAARRWRCR